MVVGVIWLTWGREFLGTVIFVPAVAPHSFSLYILEHNLYNLYAYADA